MAHSTALVTDPNDAMQPSPIVFTSVPPFAFSTSRVIRSCSRSTLAPSLIPQPRPQAVDKLVEGLRGGHKHQTLLGVTGSGKTFTMANVIARYGRPTLVISPNKTLAAPPYSD